jgi:hypothetical protein
MGEIAINPIHNVHKKYRKMNLVNHYIFTPPLTYNTFIGGVASTIGSASALATKLAIDVTRITNFSILGSDIKCKITGSYVLPSNGFSGNTLISNYLDDGDLLTGFSESNTFAGCIFLKEIKNKAIATMPGSFNFNNTPLLNSIELAYLVSCGNSSFAYGSGTFVKNIYIPRCTSLGFDSGNNNVFSGITTGSIIYCNPSLATNNAGGPDGDLAYAISQGATVRYVANYTAPSSVTTLTTGTIYNTAIQLNFTPPSSTNAIDYYECYANGVLKNRITASGRYITGLTASNSYNITVVAVDVFYNKSVVSNTINVSTNTTSAVPTSGLVSYYKLEANSNDSYGTNNGVDTLVSYASGKLSNGAIYNGTTSKTIIGNPANLQLTNVSISAWVKSSGAGSGDRGMIFKRYAYNLFFYSNKLATYSYGSPIGYKDTGVNICDGTWKHIVLTQQSGVTNGTKIYINGVLVLTTTVGQTTQTDNLEFATIAGSGNANFSIDEPCVYNVILTQNEIELIYNNGNGITL